MNVFSITSTILSMVSSCKSAIRVVKGWLGSFYDAILWIARSPFTRSVDRVMVVTGSSEFRDLSHFALLLDEVERRDADSSVNFDGTSFTSLGSFPLSAGDFADHSEPCVVAYHGSVRFLGVPIRGFQGAISQPWGVSSFDDARRISELAPGLASFPLNNFMEREV